MVNSFRDSFLSITAGASTSRPWESDISDCKSCYHHPPRESLDNLEGTQPAAYTGWPVKSEHVEVWIFQRTRNLLLWHRADHATPTGLPHDVHCLLSPRPDNG